MDPPTAKVCYFIEHFLCPTSNDDEKEMKVTLSIVNQGFASKPALFSK